MWSFRLIIFCSSRRPNNMYNVLLSTLFGVNLQPKYKFMLLTPRGRYTKRHNYVCEFPVDLTSTWTNVDVKRTKVDWSLIALLKHRISEQLYNARDFQLPFSAETGVMLESASSTWPHTGNGWNICGWRCGRYPADKQ